MIGYTNIDTEKRLCLLPEIFEGKGHYRGLGGKGIEEGDTVHIYDLDFEFWK